MSSSIDEMRYIADTLLVEKFAAIEFGLQKNAQFSSNLGGVAESIKSQMKGLIDTSSTGSIIKSVIKILEPAMLFRINPLLGILDVAAQTLFNFSLTDAAAKIIGFIAPKIMSGQQISPEEVNQAGLQLIGTQAEASFNIDWFGDLRKIAETDGIVLTAQRYGNPTGGAFLFPNKGTSTAHKIFGFLGEHKAKRLGIAFLIWTVKTVLAGAGLLLGAGAIANWFGAKPTVQEQPAQQPNFPQPQQTSFIPQPTYVSTPLISLQSSGRGEEHHPNTKGSVWMVPLNGSVRDTLVDWTVEIYPDLVGKESIIVNTPSFNKLAYLLSGYFDPEAPNYLIIAPGFHSRKQIIDQFVADVEKKLPRKPYPNASTNI